MAEATISTTERRRSINWKDEGSVIPQYILGQIILTWAAAAIRMGILQWLVAPALARGGARLSRTVAPHAASRNERRLRGAPRRDASQADDMGRRGCTVAVLIGGITPHPSPLRVWGVVLPLRFACHGATPDFSAGARLDELPPEPIRANMVLQLLYHPGAATGQHGANVFGGVELGVTPPHGRTVGRLAKSPYICGLS